MKENRSNLKHSYSHVSAWLVYFILSGLIPQPILSHINSPLAVGITVTVVTHALICTLPRLIAFLKPLSFYNFHVLHWHCTHELALQHWKGNREDGLKLSLLAICVNHDWFFLRQLYQKLISDKGIYIYIYIYEVWNKVTFGLCYLWFHPKRDL